MWILNTGFKEAETRAVTIRTWEEFGGEKGGEKMAVGTWAQLKRKNSFKIYSGMMC